MSYEVDEQGNKRYVKDNPKREQWLLDHMCEPCEGTGQVPDETNEVDLDCPNCDGKGWIE